jgi:tetratricopeptide (TPR) repeat protein
VGYARLTCGRPSSQTLFTQVSPKREDLTQIDLLFVTGDRRYEGMALDNLGAALADAGRFEEAITACQDAAAIFRETGDRHGEGDALANLGIALRGVRRSEEAITACQDAAAIFRETGDQPYQGKRSTVWA